MIIVAAVSMLAASPAPADSLGACGPAIARRVEGEVSASQVSATSRRGALKTIRGTVTALIGMGDPGPGKAKAHHLIRARYAFRCTLRGTRVRHLTLVRSE